MRRFSLTGTIVVFGTVILALTWLGVELIGRSFIADGETDADVIGLHADVDIVRDAYGIPYISASNSADAWAALGYAHAQDRLWQMDLTRRAAEGRLSEIFGRRALGFDAFMRTVGFTRTAEAILAQMPRKTRQILDAYARGVNACIRDHHGRLPIEFDALGYEPDEWTPLHSVLVVRMLGWELNLSMWSDIVYADISSRVDSVRFQEILPYYPTDGPTIVPGGQRPEPLLQGVDANVRTDSIRHGAPEVSDSLQGIDTTRTATALQGVGQIMDMEREYRQEIGLDGPQIGSNAWALSGNRTESGRPMLANDPHLPHSAPCRWYQAVVAYGGRHLAGVTLPGIPFVISGRNDNVAWGVTAMMADQTDFFVEVLDSADRRKVLRDGRWESLRQLRDTIDVKDSASVPIVVRITRHGPVISDVDPWIGKDRMNASSWGTSRDTVISMQWVGAQPTNELTALQELNESRDLKTFTTGARKGGVPGISVVYADSAGTIAYVPTASIPQREWSPVPRRGWESQSDWHGLVPMDRLPSLTSPPEGYVAAANNKVANATSYTISELWEDPSRAIRLGELLKEGNGFNVTDFGQIQADVVSPHMRFLIGYLLRAFPDSARQGSAVRDALTRLKNWDAGMRDGGPEGAIAAVWLQTVIQATYRDEMGPELFDRWVFLALHPMRALRYHVMLDSRWFDDVSTTDRVERRDDILRRSLGAALDTLHRRFDTWAIDRWSYGAIHQLTFRHPFSSNEKLRNIVNIGPYEVGGANGTINNGEWDFARPYDVRVGPTMRQIVDFGDSTAFVRSVVTSGASGQPLNEFYSNQTILWTSNGYVALQRSAPSGPGISSTTRLHPATAAE